MPSHAKPAMPRPASVHERMIFEMPPSYRVLQRNMILTRIGIDS